MAEPIVKWVGGKRQLLSELRPRFPASFDEYHEPFVGGGAVFFDLEPARGSVNDLNRKLIALYRAVRDHPERVVEENRTHRYEEAYYYDARDEFNALFDGDDRSTDETVRAASLFVYLNRSGFNGLYRENSSGEFNVPFGRHTNPDLVRERQIRRASAVLSDVEVYNADFEYVLDEATAGDLVYFDPPYEPVSETADFTEYQADGFDADDQRRLRDVAVELDEAGVDVLLSNSPPVADLYARHDAFDVETVAAARTVSRDAANRDDVAEIIVSNVDAADRRQRSLDSFG
ncbi:DNA adenine methylase [Candidatus Halobonum tyrrellensis]|uniref:site-specific DNA-methyltransferase (adenine-specific) n=1 Tax=Candidatus Halobonum tyrrellensis G22 TaxID=1324957 RepID=V4HJW3_9EURY|nr:DNA adenine methylase [Candidatus Halobonum tyrrellensis]ESP90058.1 DNA adenine methylase [Candidatus Halobonum tyrrellensis G22]